MNFFSCFATRVPSAPSADPENVRTVCRAAPLSLPPPPQAHTSKAIAKSPTPLLILLVVARPASMTEGLYGFDGFSGLLGTAVTAGIVKPNHDFLFSVFNNGKHLRTLGSGAAR